MEKGDLRMRKLSDDVLDNARIYNVNQCEVQVCKCVDSIHTQCILLIFTSSENVHRQKQYLSSSQHGLPEDMFLGKINSMISIQSWSNTKGEE